MMLSVMSTMTVLICYVKPAAKLETQVLKMRMKIKHTKRTSTRKQEGASLLQQGEN